MILAINYSKEALKGFGKAQHLNSKNAKKWGADKVVEYTFRDIDEEYKRNNAELFSRPRGAGYWVWKSYIIDNALAQVEDGDYVVYTDSGTAFINKIDCLIREMNRAGTDVMPFCITLKERQYTKRDAFILMGCDAPEYWDTPQICTGIIIVRKTPQSCAFIKKWMQYSQDIRIVSDDPNVMGKPNLPEFIENRHDQTAFSLLCKREGIVPFRDPSQYGLDLSEFSDEVNSRSQYGMVFDVHRLNIGSNFRLKYRNRWWYKFITYTFYKSLCCRSANWIRVKVRRFGEIIRRK